MVFKKAPKISKDATIGSADPPNFFSMDRAALKADRWYAVFSPRMIMRNYETIPLVCIPIATIAGIIGMVGWSFYSKPDAKIDRSHNLPSYVPFINGERRSRLYYPYGKPQAKIPPLIQELQRELAIHIRKTPIHRAPGSH